MARQLQWTLARVRSRQLLGRAAGEKMNKRVTIMNKSNHSPASMNECGARNFACQSGRNPSRPEELRARMLAEQAGKTPALPWGQWRPSSQCASKIRSVLAAFETRSEKMNKRVTIMNKSNHSPASMNECGARNFACQSGRNPSRPEELRARMLAEQAGKTPALPWGQWRPSSQCASKIRSVLAAFET